MSAKDVKNDKNFTTLRKQLSRHLSSHGDVNSLSKTFGALNSNYERVDFVLELLQNAKIQVDLQKISKNDEVALKLREQGNERFKIKQLKEAWEFYTKSISFAEANSASLGLAYANRSAVLFELNLRKQCLQDISRALQNNYPDNLKPKLFVREKNCKNLEVEAFKPHEDVPVLEMGSPRIQCCNDCLEIEENQAFGRFIKASRDIQAGEILAVEKPFTALLVSQYLNHCHECISLCYSLIPCKTCTEALYCSEECRDEAFERYHQYECAISATLRSLELDKLKILPLRIAFLVRDQYDRIANFQSDPAEIYRSDRYKEIHNLITNTEKRSVSDLFERATAAAIIFNLVKNYTNFFEAVKNERVFKEILLLHMQTGPSNFHEVTELSLSSSNNYEPEEVASGAFSFLSLLNHSCCPNVTRFCYGSTLVLRAIQDIKKGEQCFDNYGYHHAVMSKLDRQKHLKSQYYFDCVCEACLQDWPLYDELPSVENFEADEEVMEKLSSADVGAAEGAVEKNLSKLRELHKLQPCRNFCQVQEIVKQCFAILGSKRIIF